MAGPAVSHPRGTLVATGLGLFMIFLDATIVNVALPDIQRQFGVGEQGLQWVVAAYSLTMGMFIMSSASLADRYGRRRVFVAGVVVFAAASRAVRLRPEHRRVDVRPRPTGHRCGDGQRASLALVSAAFPTLTPRPRRSACGRASPRSAWRSVRRWVAC